ncbi:hypothetical protein DITRI_Ditri02bG0133700 [Diplodiscus trichospermus]
MSLYFKTEKVANQTETIEDSFRKRKSTRGGRVDVAAVVVVEDEEDGEEKDGDHVNVAAGCCPFELPSDNRIGRKAVLPQSHFIQVPHINQLFSWDCGLACVLMMALTTVGINDCSSQNLAELCCTSRFSYYTVTFGANPNYSVETYYKEQLPNDLVRGDKLFQRTVEAEINIWVFV